MISKGAQSWGSDVFDDLWLTLNAQFFRIVDSVSDEAIRRLLDAASVDAADEEMLGSEFRVQRRHIEDGFEFRSSLRVFFTERPVYFLPESDHRDRTCAFILVLEIDNYIVVLKRGCSNISYALERFTIPVQAEELTSTLDTDVAFQRLSVRNMTVSDAALRARSYEAASLDGVLSLHSAGRSIPYFVRARGADGVSSISLSTSRLADVSERLSALDVAAWARRKISRFNAPSKPRFLSAFAKSLELRAVLSKCKPVAILIEAGAVIDLLESGAVSQLYVVEAGARRALSKRVATRVLQLLGKVYEVDSSDLIVGAQAKLKRNKTTLTFTSRMLKRIHVEYEGRDLTLQALIVKEQLYSICFDDPAYMYYMGRCFRDASSMSSIDSLLAILTAKPALNSAVSEKGSPGAATTTFEPTSIFGIVERMHNRDDFVFCDDLGDEWADHVVFNCSAPSITFIHSKHGTRSTSASQLHDVVSQGIKNLGNMFFDVPKFKRKYNNKLRRRYRGTRIERTRRGSHASLDSHLQGLLSSYRVQRRCVLACDFLSKSEVAKEFANIKAGKKVRGHAVQLLWIISSFVHAARELSVEPKIYCLP